MARRGLSKPYIAVYSYDGTTVKYTNGKRLGKAISLEASVNQSDNPLYGDNILIESANTFSSGELTINVDELRADIMHEILGVKELTITIPKLTTTGVKAYDWDDTQSTPYLGLGFIAHLQVENQPKYVPFIFPKIKFQNPNDSFSTQGESVEWKTPELKASILRDDTTTHKWKRVLSFLDSEEDAELVIKTFFSIPTEVTK